ncbi:lysozyme [Henriciella aquimarina]|uniref:lysozyme n=1 Tax=Henriciella aquimarina TaxID=545261 RepID=UPI0009FC351C|nr:lysozyme [Henriciella aquimarina]
MASELRTSEAGLKLIMAYEGFRAHSCRLPDGRWVIGYGHLKAAREGLRVSQAEATAILREFDLPPIEQAIRDLVLVPLNQNEFDALVSFVFNIGTDQFAASNVLTDLNAGDRMMAASSMERWRKAKVGPRDMVVDPLVRRRADEKALFLKTTGAVPLAASSRFRPIQDLYDVRESGRNFTIVETTDMDAAEELEDEVTETAPEAAARNVRERLTRILGEQAPAGMAAEAAAAGEGAGHDASVEEIRAAISALVAEEEDETGEGEPFDLEASNDNPYEVETGPLKMAPGEAAEHRGLYIDDVSPVDIPPADPSLQRDDSREGPLETGLFGLVALIGALLAVYGGAKVFGWLGTAGTQTGLAAYLSPFLLLCGGLIFVIMAYYFVRAVGARD